MNKVFNLFYSFCCICIGVVLDELRENNIDVATLPYHIHHFSTTV